MTEHAKRKISEVKVKRVQDLSSRMKHARSVLIASCKGLPSSQFHSIKKELRGVAEVTMIKKKAAERAMDLTQKKGLAALKEQLQADIAFFFSSNDPFELSGLLSEKQVPSKARAGDIAPEDIEIQPGPTDLVPGPAISELSGVGLKVAVKEGKLEIIKGAIVAKKGEAIKENVASVLGKLGVSPIRVGFRPLAAYDSHDDKTYVGIAIDKAGALEHLRDSIKKALGFAAHIKYPTPETVRYFISKAVAEEKAIQHKVDAHTTTREGS
jgi:ribosomal protein L10